MKKIYTSLKGIAMTTALLFMLTTTSTTAQTAPWERPDIFSFSSPERAELADLIIDFVDTNILQMHCDYTTIMNNPMHHIHDDFNFLPFHRVYLEKLEDWLILEGYSKYVPLPKWTGLVPPPDEFRTAGPNNNGISPACSTTSCGEAPDPNNFPFACAQASQSVWQNHTVFMPPNLILPNLCNLDFDPATFTVVMDECCPNALSREIEVPWHNFGHSGFVDSSPQNPSGSTVMLNYRSPSAAIFWIWHAAVDEKWKEWECNCPNNTTNTTDPIDLYMKDNPLVVTHYRDRGEEPNPDPGSVWLTEDIWVRNLQDGHLTDEHQNPEYSPTQPVYVYVRIRNRGCQVSSGTEKVDLHWSKTGTSQSWPNYWNGSETTSNGILLGNLVASSPKTISSIKPGDSEIIMFEWYPPNPDDYNTTDLGDDTIYEFCLIARIENPELPTPPHTITTVRNNNNFVWKNLVVDDNIIPRPCHVIAVGNGTEEPEQTIDLQFATLNVPRNGEIWEEAEVIVTLDTETWNRWTAGGMQAENMQIFREEERKLIVTGNNAYLRNLAYTAPFQRSLICLRFNFLIEEVTGREEFRYQVIQRRSDDQSMMGGQAFDIRRDVTRPAFLAGTQSTTDPQTENTQLSAPSIGELATYNWYANDSLVHTGTSMNVSPATDQEYKLEVIADADGHKDYETVSVVGTSNDIESMTPNPASSSVVITYDVEQATTASLQVNSLSGTPLGTYSLDLTTNQKSIDVSNYPIGLCIVTLTVDGENTDSENLVIE